MSPHLKATFTKDCKRTIDNFKHDFANKIMTKRNKHIINELDKFSKFHEMELCD